MKRTALIFRIALCCCLLLAPAACGYRLEGHRETQQPRQRLYIELFENRTSRAFVNDTLTVRVVERFARSPLFRIVESRADADLILAGALLSYVTEPVAYNRLDAIVAYRVNLEVQSTVRRAGEEGRVLWRGTRGGNSDYPANPDLALQQNAERSAVALVCERLADDLYVRVTDELAWSTKQGGS